MNVLLLYPETREIELQSGKTRTFIVSKIPAIAAREIISQYPISAMPRVGDYGVNEGLMLKLLSYAAVPKDGEPLENGLRLETRALVDNHTEDWETLAKLEWELIEHNCSFFADGKISTFFDDLAAKLPELISSILTPLLERSSQPDEPTTTS